ncbi:MAG: hypothetical protein V2I36_03900 [Desulfopila sp.]|jgi:hypothetical protein|nr:hypothetical protein [Desulfopila sp.]
MKVYDPELLYCPRCGDEYRPEIVLCAACGLKLLRGADIIAAGISGDADPGDGAVITENDELIALQRGSVLDMKQLKNVLERAAVPAVLVKDHSCRSGCCGPEVVLHVRVQDEKRAVMLLIKEFERTTALDDYAVGTAEAVFDQSFSRVICPACNCEFTPDGPSCPDCGLCFL